MFQSNFFFLFSTDSETSTVKRSHQYSFLQSEEVSESDSEQNMLKRARFIPSQNFSPTEPLNVEIGSGDTSYGSDTDTRITNVQQCKFGTVDIEMSNGETGNGSTMSAQPESTRSASTNSIQPPITKHFQKDPSRDIMKPLPENTHDSVPSTSRPTKPQPSYDGVYSLVWSGVALSNL